MPNETNEQLSAMERFVERVAGRGAGTPPPDNGSGEKETVFTALPGLRDNTNGAEREPGALERWEQRHMDRAEGNAPPTHPAGYGLALEGVDPQHINAFQEIALETGLTKKQAADVATKYREYAAKNAETETATRSKAVEESHRAITAKLKTAWGDEFEGNSRAVHQLTQGLSDVQFHSLVQRLLLEEARRQEA
jgi:hypothetical protein